MLCFKFGCVIFIKCRDAEARSDPLGKRRVCKRHPSQLHEHSFSLPLGPCGPPHQKCFFSLGYLMFVALFMSVFQGSPASTFIQALSFNSSYKSMITAVSWSNLVSPALCDLASRVPRALIMDQILRVKLSLSQLCSSRHP